MKTHLLRDSVGWGFALWLTGYVLGIALFFVVPASVIGWTIMPVGVAISLWVLVKKIDAATLLYFALLAIVWTTIAVAFDYVFIVKTFQPADGYYKLDVYLYYAFTFLMPVGVGWMRENRRISA